MRLALIIIVSALVATGRARAADKHPFDRAPELLAEMTPLVEKACGAKFAAPPDVQLLSTSAAEAAYVEDMRPEFERRYADKPDAQREGMLKLSAASSVRSCLARYSVERRGIVLIRESFDAQCALLDVAGDRATELLRSSLAHECVHALDDARFSLAKLYRGAADDEAMRAVAMVAEGRAVHFGRIAATEAGVPKDLADLLPGGASPRNVAAWHANLTYRLGARFIDALVLRGGVALADKAIAEPPAATWYVCVATRWPDGRPDARPASVLARAGLGQGVETLSELRLRGEYAASAGFDACEKLFESFAGGAQSLVEGTNSAVLAFVDEESAKRYEEVSRGQAPTTRRGTLVARSIGPAQDVAIQKLATAIDEPSQAPR